MKGTKKVGWVVLCLAAVGFPLEGTTPCLSGQALGGDGSGLTPAAAADSAYHCPKDLTINFDQPLTPNLETGRCIGMPDRCM